MLPVSRGECKYQVDLLFQRTKVLTLIALPSRSTLTRLGTIHSSLALGLLE